MTNHGLLKPEVGNLERWAGLTLMLDLARLYTALLAAFNLRWGCRLTSNRRSQWVGRFWPACLVHHVLCQFASVHERWSEHVAAVSPLCVLVACFSSQLPGLSHQVVVLLRPRKVKSFLFLPRHPEGKAGGADQGLPKWKCFLLWHLPNLPAHCLVFIITVVWTLTRSCSHLNNQGWITMVKDVCASEQTIDKGF